MRVDEVDRLAQTAWQRLQGLQDRLSGNDSRIELQEIDVHGKADRHMKLLTLERESVRGDIPGSRSRDIGYEFVDFRRPDLSSRSMD